MQPEDINILTKRKKKEAKKKEKITTITNLFCLLYLGQDTHTKCKIQKAKL
jgi:hypothetical protein